MDSKHSPKLKFLCSYGGKILPRSTDGVLRYVGGYTRVLSVDPSISFSDLMVKIVEFCGSSVTLKCPLPNGDLETLITIANDEDLAIIIEEYKRASSSKENPLKIRAVLSPPRSLKKVSPPPSSRSSANLSSTVSTRSSTESLPYSPAYGYRVPVAYPAGFRHGSRKACRYNGQFYRRSRFLNGGPSCPNFCH
ncbi:hypothetical protein QN277_025575 [Acacia crassicarpa]|uniref:PB1 domain-containing protein n=1 Tax=Acacia crassicarpa TaxID=499986 RepID=A0AAE1J7K6_9FABA|nr:hypothetical protein QN277_025575 [Acacia crassicarpa]